MIYENVVPDEVQKNKAKAAIVTFVQPNCGHCHSYLPIFRRMGAAYAHCLPVIILDVTKPEFNAVADHFNVQATPTTIVLVRGRKPIIAEGHPDLEKLFGLAVQGLSCAL